MSAERIPPELPGVAALAARFGIFLIDQFGVLRGGQKPYPGAVEALDKLKQAGKRIVILSNSGKRAAPNERRLELLGFRRESWDLFLSSGEVARRLLGGELGVPPRPAGTRCLLLARDGDESAVEGLDLAMVDTGEEADLVLIAGSEGERRDLGHYRALLEPAALRGVPALCTNPDKIILTADGPKFGAGRIAELYESLGGPVEWIGKPFPAIYDAALDLLGRPDKAEVVAVGDSVEHDVAGAQRAGVAAALVRSGIHADLDAAELGALFGAHAAAPDFILPGFRWAD